MKENNYDSSIYQQAAQTVIGFHGCDKSVAKEILNSPRKHLIASTNSYDWLGDGIYFWLNDPQRAYEWACQTHKRKPNIIKEPYVLGAVINLGVCLNFCERNSILLLQKSYNMLEESFKKLGLSISNELKNQYPDDGGFNLIRPLDCAVIKTSTQ